MISDVKKTAEQKMSQVGRDAEGTTSPRSAPAARTPGLLDHIHVDYYGTTMPINQVANVTLADARTIAVQPFEKKMIPVVEKAIRDSDLGLNPATSRRRDPRADAGAHRGAPPGAHQGRAQGSGGARRSPCATSAATRTST